MFCQHSLQGFDERAIQESLVQFLQDDQILNDYDVQIKVRYIARKFELPNQLVVKILNLLQKDLNHQQAEILGQIIKYSVQKGSNISLQNMHQIYFNTQNKNLKDQILESIIVVVRKSTYQRLTSQDKKCYNQITQDGQTNLKTKLILQEMMKPKEFIQLNCSEQIKFQSYRILNSQKTQSELQLNQYQYYSYSIQSQGQACDLQYNQDNQQFLQQNDQIANDTSPFQNQNLQGTDRKWLNSTYEDIIILYNKAQSNQLLKADDKDEFLPSRLLETKYFCGSLLREFICDRMILSIFLILVTRKDKNRQLINDKAIMKIVQLCQKSSKVFKLIFRAQEKLKVINSIKDEQISKIAQNEIELEFQQPLRMEDPQLFLKVQINKIRIDAQKIIYNLSKFQHQFYNTKLKIQLNKNLFDENQEFQLLSFLTYIQLKEQYQQQDVLENCLNQLKKQSEQAILSALEGIKDIVRHKNELINDQVLSQIFNTLFQDNLSFPTLISCSNLLKYCLNQNSKLLLQDIDKISEFMFSLKQKELILNLLEILYILSSRQLEDLKNIANKLAKKIKMFDNSHLIISLLIIKFQTNFLEIQSVEEISNLLKNDKIIINNRNNYTLQDVTQQNCDRESISSISGEIIFNFFEVTKIKVNNPKNFIENLLAGLDNKSSKTRLISAKILLEKSDFYLNQQQLDLIVNHLKDQILEVQIYSTVIYTKQLNRISTNEELFQNHVEILQYLFQDQERLENQQFFQIINNNIIEILFNLVKHYPNLIEKLSYLICTILMSSQKIYYSSTLDILNLFIQQNHQIPDKLMDAIESLFDEYKGQCLKLIESVVQNKNSVPVRIVKKIVFIMKFDREFAEKSFQILNQLDQIQDLTDEEFNYLEIERAGISIRNHSKDSTYAINFLENQVQQENELTCNTLLSFGNSLKDERILRMILKITQSQQRVPVELVNQLFDCFDPEKSQNLLIKIFINLSRNRQQIDAPLMEKFQNALNNHSIVDDTLAFFASYGTNDHTFNFNIFNQICLLFQQISNQQLKKQVLNVLVIQIDQIDKNSTSIELFRKVLISQLNNSSNSQFVINGLRKVLNLGCFKENLASEILKSTQYKLVERNVKKEMINILSKINLNLEQQQIFDQLKANQIDNLDQYFEELTKIEGLVLQQETFDTFSKILQTTTDPKYVDKIIQLLINCRVKGQIPKELIREVSNFYKQSSLCQNFIDILIDHRIELDDEVLVNILNCIDAQKTYRILQTLQQYQTIPQQILMQYQNRGVIQKILKLKQDLEDGNICHIQQVIEIYDEYKKSKDKGQNLSIIYDALIRACEYSHTVNDKVVSIIEKGIQDEVALTSKIVNFYSLLLLDNKAKNQQMTIDKLIARQYTDNSIDLQYSILKCYAIIAEYYKMIQLNENVIQFFFSKINEQDNVISFISLNGLKFLLKSTNYQQNNNNQYKEYYLQYLQDRINQINEKFQTHISLKMIYIENLVYLKYINAELINQNPDDLIEKLIIQNFSEKYKFDNQQLLEELVTQFLGVNKNCYELLTLILQMKNLSCDQLIELFKISGNNYQELQKACFLFDNPNSFLKEIWINKNFELQQNPQQKQNVINCDMRNVQIQNKVELIQQMKKFSIDLLNQIKDKKLIDQQQKDLELLIQLLSKYSITKPSYNLSINNITLLQQYQIIILLKKLKYQNINDEHLLSMLRNIVQNNEFEFTILEKILDDSKINSPSDETILLKVLNIFQQFKIGFNSKIEFIFKESNDQWIQLTNKKCLDLIFPTKQGEIKDQQSLIEELKQQNISFQQDEINEIGQQLNNIKVLFRDKNQKFNEWGEKQIKQWANQVKEMNLLQNPQFLTEALVVIYQANLLAYKLEITNAQIISSLVCLNKKEASLLQVSTGEGKSTIISIIAIIEALKGKKIDIITNSPILAERDAQGKASIYKLFGLTCDHNCDILNYTSGKKKCYESTIVYGDVAQFQFDYLRDKYNKLQTLGNRKQDCVIVDEVDSMLIDDGSKLAKLSSSISGFDIIKPIYFKIWQKLESQEVKGYKIYSKDKIFKSIKKFIENKMKMPKHLNNHSQRWISQWIDNACLAKRLQEKIHYIVHDDLIKPVDYYSTGIIQENSFWCHGLHQFLQIKHQLRVSSETLTTSFLSNMQFFQKYGKNLVGFTGTIGSENDQQLLKKIYNVEIVFIPNQRNKQFIEYPLLVAKNEEDWIKLISDSAMDESSKGRGVLIICETIAQTEKLFETLSNSDCNIKLYNMNNMNLEQKIEKVLKGEVIIATNLAGRGTDINTYNVQEFGGLHVILTFLPQNQRVEDQAFGRTSRQGQIGSGQMILNKINGELIDIKRKRDEEEANRLKDFVENRLGLIKIKDELFSSFCRQINKIRKKLIQQKYSIQFQLITISYLEEKWALFLNDIEDGIIKIENADFTFNEFINQIDVANQQFIKNPYHLILLGNWYLQNDSIIGVNFEESRKYFEQAIKYDENISYPAYFGLGVLLLKQGEIKEVSFNNQAIEKFKKAVQLIQYDLVIFYFMQSTTKKGSQLYNQFEQYISILGQYNQSIKNNIDAIQRIERCICIERTSQIEDGNQLEVFDQIKLQNNNYIIKQILEERNPNSFSIIYSNLIQWQDLTIQDQAIDLLKKSNNILGDNQEFSFNLEFIVEQWQTIIDIFELNNQNQNNYNLDLCSFLPMNKNNIISLLEMKISEHISLQIQGKTETVQQVFNEEFEFIKNIQIIDEDEKIKKTFSKFKANSYLQNNQQNETKLTIQYITKSQAQQIVNSIDVEKFNLIFHNINQIENLAKIQCQLIAKFQITQQSVTIKIIEILRSKQQQFRLGFDKLSQELAKKIIGIEIMKENVMVKNLQKVYELFLEDSRPNLELTELAERGIEFTLEIGEKRFLPWKTITIISALSIIQIALGAGLILVPGALTYGIGTIVEGFVDFLTIYQTYKERQLSWKGYFAQKLLSYFISLPSAGISSIKNVEQLANRQYGNVFHHIGYSMYKFTPRMAILTFGLMLAKYDFNSIRDILNNKLTELIQNQLYQYQLLIKKYVAAQSFNSQCISLSYIMDNQIKQIINLNQFKYNQCWIDIRTMFTRNAFFRKGEKINLLELTNQLIFQAKNTQQLNKIFELFFIELIKAILDQEKQYNTFMLLISNNFNLDQNSSQTIHNNLKSENIIKFMKYNEFPQFEIINPELINYQQRIQLAINLIDKPQIENQQIVEFLVQFYQKTNEIDINKYLSHSLVKLKNTVINQTIKILDNQLFQFNDNEILQVPNENLEEVQE